MDKRGLNNHPYDFETYFEIHYIVAVLRLKDHNVDNYSGPCSRHYIVRMMAIPDIRLPAVSPAQENDITCQGLQEGTLVLTLRLVFVSEASSSPARQRTDLVWRFLQIGGVLFLGVLMIRNPTTLFAFCI